MLSYQIVAGFNKRESKSIEWIWENYRPRVYNNIMGMIQDPDEADDLTSQAFCNLLHSRKTFGSLRKIRNFLLTTAKNSSVNHLDHQEIVESSTDGVKYHYRQTQTDDPEEAEIVAALRNRIYAVVKRLSPKTREVFILHFSQGLKNREIAARLGISEKAVEKHKTILYKVLKVDIETNRHLIFSIIFL